jgi:hypothetical protein
MVLLVLEVDRYELLALRLRACGQLHWTLLVKKDGFLPIRGIDGKKMAHQQVIESIITAIRQAHDEQATEETRRTAREVQTNDPCLN